MNRRWSAAAAVTLAGAIALPAAAQSTPPASPAAQATPTRTPTTRADQLPRRTYLLPKLPS